MQLINETVERIKYPVYFVLLVVINMSYLLLGIGILLISREYLHILTVAFHILICLFLIYRFNPFVKARLLPHDNYIIFGSTLLLLFNVVFLEIGIDIDSVFSFVTSKLNSYKFRD